jgi:hypothetical protein
LKQLLDIEWFQADGCGAAGDQLADLWLHFVAIAGKPNNLGFETRVPDPIQNASGVTVSVQNTTRVWLNRMVRRK